MEGFLEKGIETYLSDHSVPFSGKLTEEQEGLRSNHLEDHLNQDVKPIIKWVQQEFGVTNSIIGIRDLLHRLDFVYRKTKAVLSRAGEQEQRTFLHSVLPPLIEEAKSGEAVVYYADGTHPTHNTKTGHGLIRKSQEFPIDCNSGRKRVNINAAVNALNPEHLVYDLTESVMHNPPNDWHSNS
ncbi:MAG: winged helix-turn-helix domain-containing protein [Bacteroidota bacterium]